jgi:molybdopterin-guanine dinucleotide biosynthesis adapter protein
MYTKIIAFVGRGSLSGKTSVLERVIVELKARGKKLTVVKHGIHIEIPDKDGKDTFRFARQGADRIMMFSDDSLFMYENKPPDVAYLAGIAVKDMDIVLVEGFKAGPFRKIEVFNSQVYQVPLCLEHPSPDYIAVVSDTMLDLPIPRFGFNDTHALCDMIEELTKS